MFRRNWAFDSGENPELDIDNKDKNGRKRRNILIGDKSSVFEQLKIFGLEGIKSLSGQMGKNIKEKTKTVFSKALGLFRKKDNGGNDDAIKSFDSKLNQGELDGESEQEGRLDDLVDVNSLLKRSSLDEEKIEGKEKVSVIKSFEVNGLGDLFFKLKNIYLEIAKKKNRMDYQEGGVTEEMISKFAMAKIAEFEQKVVENIVEKRRMNKETAIDFVGHRYKLSSQIEGLPVFELVKIDDGKKRVELRSNNFLTFNLFDKFPEGKDPVVANQITENVMQKTTNSSDVISQKKELDGKDKFLKIESDAGILSVAPIFLNKILFDFKKQTVGSVDFYNDYYEVFDMKAWKIVDILHKISKQGEPLSNKKLGLLNEIIYSTGEPTRDESFGEYLDRYLWGQKLSSIYKEVVNATKILSRKDNYFDEDILKKSAKEVFDIIISRLDELDPELISSLFSLRLKESMPSNTESLGVYFSRLAVQNNDGKNKNAKRVVDFLQEVTPKIHKILLLNREQLVRQNKNSNFSEGEKVKENGAKEIPYYSYG
jgi:hypothetical protein